MRILWEEKAWNDYVAWQQEDKKTLKKLNTIIKDILRSPYEGLGKPEPLKENLSGWWSRRIDDFNRIVYRIENEKIIIVQCGTHYHK